MRGTGRGRYLRTKVWLHRHLVARTGMRPLTLVRGVAGLRRALRDGRDVKAVARRLTLGWGNPRYAASPELLATVIREAGRRPGALVECGSGVTTIVLAAASKHLGTPAVTFENDPAWAATVRRRLRRLGLPDGGVLHRPLTERAGCDWYDVGPGDVPDAVGLLLCDGPPASTRGGRTGVLDLVQRVPPRVVVLDDVDREPEQQLGARLEDLGYVADPTLGAGLSAHAVLRAKDAVPGG